MFDRLCHVSTIDVLTIRAQPLGHSRTVIGDNYVMNLSIQSQKLLSQKLKLLTPCHSWHYSLLLE